MGLKQNYLFIGDLHIRADKDYWVDAFTAFTQFCTNLELPENTTIIQLGDFFDKKTPSPVEWKLAFEFLDAFKNNQIVILSGNHTLSSRENLADCCSLFPSIFPNIKFIETPQMIDNDIAVLPYLPSARLTEYTEFLALDPLKPKTILYHFP